MLKTITVEACCGARTDEVAKTLADSADTPSVAPNNVGTAAARNACKLCAPLGACVVFSGLQGCVPFLHGSQGCATYIRRYLISHFREPVDIGSSSFSEEETVFGGAKNLQAGLANIASQYRPASIGVATTCLAETIGEDVPRILDDFTRSAEPPAPPLIQVSTPSYAGTHIDGFHAAVLSVAKRFAKAVPHHGGINLLPGFVSPEDLRHLKEIMVALGSPVTLLPDYSDTLDGQTWSEYQRIQVGGTPLEAVAHMPGARATFEFGHSLAHKPDTAAGWLEKQFKVPRVPLGLPIGLRETDRFFAELERISGTRIPDSFYAERGRLLDAMVDGHKYVFGKRAALYGDPDLVIGIASFLNEIGIQPVLCATGTAVRRTAMRDPDSTAQSRSSAAVRPNVGDNRAADIFSLSSTRGKGGGEEVPCEVPDLGPCFDTAMVSAHPEIAPKTASSPRPSPPKEEKGIGAPAAPNALHTPSPPSSALRPGGFESLIRQVVTDVDTSQWVVMEGADHAQIAERVRELKPDLLLGSSKGYPISHELDAPLVRVGFPIHDRIGGQRVLHLGYRGAQQLYDRIVNTLLERCQDDSEVGYSYL